MTRRALFWLLLLPCLAWPGMGWGAVAYISSMGEGSPDLQTFTTAASDTSGANLIVCGLGQDDSVTIAVVTDSKGNTYSTTTVYTSSAGRSTLMYAINPTVGSGHTWTVTRTSAAASIACAWFSGANTTAPFNVGNGATSVSAASLATGSITAADDTVAVATRTGSVLTSNMAIDNSFTLVQDVQFVNTQHFPVALAYKINPGTVNPTWSWTTNAVPAAAIGSFLASVLATVPAQGFGWFYGGQ